METRAHHVLIGTFAILAFLLGLGVVLWLSKTSADREFGYYDVVFTEAVTGLSKGGLVQYNGIKVGEVTQLKLAPDDPRKVIARVRLDSDTPVKADTEAKLGLLGVTGTAFIQLSGGSPNSKPLRPTEAQPVPVIHATESALSKLMSSGTAIVTSRGCASDSSCRRKMSLMFLRRSNTSTRSPQRLPSNVATWPRR